MAEVFDARPCFLGEGPLWHPQIDTLFWFDIIGKRLLARGPEGTAEWPLEELHSAAGWLDAGHLLIASETGLWRFEIATGARSLIVPLEAENPLTRSNDGRADPWGGFWISTMGKKAEPGAGAVYRFWRGELRQVAEKISIPNAICFAPDRHAAYFADTARHIVWRQPLDADGWPEGAAQVFRDFSEEGLSPDGAVTDATGALWMAQWGAGRVARYLPDGRFDRAIAVPAPHVSCPAFAKGRLMATTAQEGMDAAALAAAPLAGQLFDLGPVDHARPEPAVVL
ncbi:MAG: SMP-30/gluconolactonase/LRE family protein [Gemmobacter sp.]|uniref:SMP-30/gluconolactonase/LRE family protein n=1 Tax=Gemmobacter sp. TaxID=1898957 RepID=UPI001A534ABC|nr:SMP-30/gluconolactonase/LRE family protein [Gemmobacter sp.]MBL8563764.1 SMP-30/gluconolactonase/LRE family protein [Gemmobacter sp.]